MSLRSPNEVSPPLPDRVLVGRIRRPHGVRGELLVDVVSDVPGRLAPGRELWLETADGAGRPITVAANRPHSRGALLLFGGIDDRDAAELLRGAVLETERGTVTPAPAGSYYYFELTGCLCRDTTHGELGQVCEVIEDGGGLLLEVRAGERRLLVPFVEEYVAAVDVTGRRIDLQLPSGLLETCTSASLNNFLSYKLNYPKDHSGYCIAVLSIRFLYFLKEGDLKGIERTLKELEQYNSSHLDKRSNYRNSVFIRMINLVPDNEFNAEIIKEKGDVYFKKLKKTRIPQEPYSDLEVYPFDKIWEEILQILENDKQYVHYKFYHFSTQ